MSDAEILVEVTHQGVLSDEEEAGDVSENVEEADPLPPTMNEIMNAVEILNQMTLFCPSGDEIREQISSIESSLCKGKSAMKKQATIASLWSK